MYPPATRVKSKKRNREYSSEGKICLFRNTKNVGYCWAFLSIWSSFVLSVNGMVEYHRFLGKYCLVPGSVKSVQAEYGESIPPNLDAADLNKRTNEVYLISGEYSMRHQLLSVKCTLSCG